MWTRRTWFIPLSRYSLVTEGKIYFLGRPRRFGKSLLVSTLEHYFLGHKELFKGLKIDSLEKDWLEYPVFHIDFNSNDFEKEGTLERKLEGYMATWERLYGSDSAWTDLGDRFAAVLKRAHERTGAGERTGIFAGGLEPEDFAGILFGIQGGGCGFAICFADGGDEVPPGERVQRLQPAQ